MEPMILQPEIIMDDALLNAFVVRYYELTDEDRCNFILVVKNDGRLFLRKGCFCLPTGETYRMGTILENWLWGHEEREIFISPETKRELLSRKPCRNCGGSIFEKPPEKIKRPTPAELWKQYNQEPQERTHHANEI